jgi:DNA polymerase III epsilon subunit-like protein
MMPRMTFDAAASWPSICHRLLPIFHSFYQKFPNYGPLVFLDTETTGMKNGDIIELAAISVDYCANLERAEMDAFCQLIYPGPGTTMPPWVIEIHGITNEMLRKNGRPPMGVLASFVDWASEKSARHFVAHCASFDKGMLEWDFSKHGIAYDMPDFLCTVKMAKGLPTENRKLGTLAAFYSFPNRQAHRGLADSEVCAYIFAKMMLTRPLMGQAATIVGDLPTLSRECAEELLKQLGARVTKRPTPKTTIVLAGNAQDLKLEKELEKAVAMGAEIRDEEWLKSIEMSQ